MVLLFFFCSIETASIRFLNEFNRGLVLNLFQDYGKIELSYCGLNKVFLIFDLFQVKRAFDHAYIVLTSAITPFITYSSNNFNRISILGRIIHVTDEVVRYRQWIERTFTNQQHQQQQQQQQQVLSPPIHSPAALQFTVRAPRSLSSSGSTSSVDSGGSSEVTENREKKVHFKCVKIFFYSCL